MNERNEQMSNQPGTTNGLTVAAQQADASKGGPRLIIKKAPTFADEAAAALPDLAPNGDVKGGPSTIERPPGGFINNHNEVTVNDEADDSDAMVATLLDLPLACDGAEVKGGGSRCSTCGEVHRPPPGGFINNHNETIAMDEDEEGATTAPLADLPVSDEQAEQTQGGARVNIRWERLRVPFA